MKYSRQSQVRINMPLNNIKIEFEKQFNTKFNKDINQDAQNEQLLNGKLAIQSVDEYFVVKPEIISDLIKTSHNGKSPGATPLTNEILKILNKTETKTVTKIIT